VKDDTMLEREADVLARWRKEARIALPGADPDLVEEVAQFVSERWLQARRSGLDAEVADARARTDLGAWRGRPVPRRTSLRPSLAWIGLGADLRHAGRSLRLRPAFSVGATLLSSIAIAAVATAAALLYGILWRPLPYPEADRLAVIWEVTRGQDVQISYPDYSDVASAPVFDGRAAMSGGRGSLRIGEHIHRVNLLGIEAEGYALLGARPVLGRLLTAADADQPIVMISHRLWSTLLGGDPNVLGRQLWLSGRTLTVVGVLQPSFDFELPVPPAFKLEKNDLWMVLERNVPFVARRDVSGYEALARLAPGTTMEEAQAAATAIGERLAREHPGTNAGRTFRVAALHDEVTAPVRRPLQFVGFAAVVTLLVALANLVVLGLVRGADRQAELSIRHALGAGSFRLRRQLLTENLLIAVCGGLAGLLLARGVVTALLENEASRLPRPGAVTFDTPVLVMAAAVVLLIAGLLTLQPIRVAPASLRSGSRTATPAARRTRRAMVVTEVALAIMLATGGAALALSFARLLATDPGFNANGVATARISAYSARYPTREATVQFFERVLARLREIPDVSAAGAGFSLPLSGQLTGTAVEREEAFGTTGPAPGAGWQFVTPGYFEAVGISRLAGRDFEPADLQRREHVVIINEQVAKMLFPGENPIGRRISVGGGGARGDWHEVVGVVRDVRHQALDVDPSPRVYDLFGQHFERTIYVVARSATGDASTLVSTIRRVAYELDPDAPVFELAPMASLVGRSAAPRRLARTVAAWLAGAAVLLAFIGVYAVAAAGISERTRELGVRAALGASPRELFALTAREGGLTAAAGGLIGLAGGFLLVRLLQAQLFGVRPDDAWWILPLVTGILVAGMALAAVPSALRAAWVDPLTALRTDR
jgi:putative ABC transport system permease protein